MLGFDKILSIPVAEQSGHLGSAIGHLFAVIGTAVRMPPGAAIIMRTSEKMLAGFGVAMNIIRRGCGLLVAGILISTIAEAQPAVAEENKPEARPRVGLVLGGGGARGAAHIGVLRELERLRGPVDAIAGTRMGAIVGGLYASGHTVDELEDIVRNIDWQDAFNDDVRREDKRFRRKQDDVQYPIGVELGVRDGAVQLPRGAITGQKVAMILRSLTLNVPVDSEFDDLPIPYRAVAADLATGEPYVMASGDLAKSIRASMAAPGLIAPVEIDGHILVDGGLEGNVPVDAIRDMDVDIIIAVDVEFPLYPPEQLKSALDVTAQMLTILIRKQTRDQLARLGPDDFLIRPELGQFGSANFAEIEQAIEPGAAAARALAADLGELSIAEDDYTAHLAARQSRVRPLPETIDFVRVDSAGQYSPRVLRARIETEHGDALDVNKLENDAGSLYGLNTFERVGYRLVKDGERDGVEFTGTGKSWGPNYLLFGLSLQDDFEGSTAFNLSARLTRTAINPLGAEWRNDIQLGTQPELRSEFYQPLSFDSRVFVAPRISLEQDNFNVFLEQTRLARYRVSEAEVGLDVGRELGTWGEARLGLFRGRGRAELNTGVTDLPNLTADAGGYFARLAVDTLDDGQIPRHGARARFQWTKSSSGLGADNDADFLETSFRLVRSVGRHTLELGAELNVALEDTDLVQNYYPLGGFLRLSGLARGEIAGPHAGFARLVYYRRSGNTGGGLFDVPLYLGASLEAGNAWQRRSDIDFASTIANGSVFLGLDTFFGPIYLAAGFAEGGRSNFYLSLGALP